MLFRRGDLNLSGVPDAASKRPQSPYLAAREEWNERYGDYIARARNWRLVAVIAIMIALVLSAGTVYVAAQSKYVPYIVEVDKLGQVGSVTLADKASPTNPRFVKAMLTRFVSDWRSVSVDMVIQKSATLRLYKMLAQGSPALAKINGYFKENSPFVVGQNAIISVEPIGLPLPLSAQSWQLEWLETKRTLSGTVIAQARYKGVLTVVLKLPADETALDLDNPIGFFVTDLNWTHQL